MVDPGIESLLPVIATLLVALALRNVLAGLFTGVLIGALLLGSASALQFFPRVVSDLIVPEVSDSYNASVLVLLAFIGGFVKLIESSGGGEAFARSAVRRVSGRVRVQVAAWIGGIMIFFSDLGTPLIVGPVFQPLVDRLRVSRQKLAFILDSTSSPVAILIPFIGWGVFIMSVIADAFRVHGMADSEWDAFVAAIPFQLYAWLAIAIVPVLALLRFDYGPMRATELAAQHVPLKGDPVDVSHSLAKPILVWLPLAILCTTLFATLAQHGFPFRQVAGSDFRAGLSAAYFLAALTLMLLSIAGGVQSLQQNINRYIDGVTGMMPIAATLVLAWTLGSVSESLGTGDYVAEVARDALAGWVLPALVFVLAAIISFATGSSWGTIIIMMPLAVPAALATAAPMPVVIGAVLSGGLFGDHSSPVSETTILSSTGAGTTPLEHFRTQLPYALTNGALAFCGFLFAGYFDVLWIVLPLLVVQFAVLIVLRRRQSRPPA
jgi:Na+/H+ antiporter NhaC